MSDWFKLKNEFVMSDIDTLSTFLSKKHIKRSGSVGRQTKGWVQARKVYWEKIEQRVQQKVATQIVDELKDTALRHARAARVLQMKGLKALSKQKINNVREAGWFIVHGMREERAALGLDDKNKHTSEMTSPPETHFTKQLKNMSNSELIEVLKTLDK